MGHLWCAGVVPGRWQRVRAVQAERRTDAGCGRSRNPAASGCGEGDQPMKSSMGYLRGLAIALLLFAGVVAAADPLAFRDAAEEARFRELTAELRCPMCQNPSLADSSAPIAQDLRREVFELMREGKSDGQIGRASCRERVGQ